MNFQTWLKDTAEKAVNTLWQVLIPFVALGIDWNVSWWKPVIAAAVPVLFGVIKNAFMVWAPQPKTWWADAVVRVAWTFVIAFAGAASIGGLDLYSVSTWRALLMGAFPAVLAVIKVIAAKQVAHTISPASLAKLPSTTATPVPVVAAQGGTA